MPLSNFGSAPAASGRDGRSAAEANPTPRIARFILWGNMQMPLANFGSAPAASGRDGQSEAEANPTQQKKRG